MKVSKTKSDDRFLYINVHGFKDEAEWDLMYKRICQVVEDSKGRVKVY